MITALVILGVSFVAMAGMLKARHYEIKIGRQVLAVRHREWAEKQVKKGAHLAKSLIQIATTKHFWESLYKFFTKKFMEKVWHHPHVRHVARKANDVVRGKKEIKSKGPVSFYLKDVSDFKKQVRSQ